MIFDMPKERKVYIELTNLEHGGEGWGFGEVLWSPAKNKAGRDAWKILKQIEPGDIVFHSAKVHPKRQMLRGISMVKSSYIETKDAPPLPGKWAGYETYLRVPLYNYSSFCSPLSVSDFLVRYKNELTEIGTRRSFYTRDANNIAEKYASEVPCQVAELLCDFVVQQGNTLFGNLEYVGNTGTVMELVSPPRVETTTTRIIRDTKIIRDLKSKYKDQCQVCGARLQLPNGNGYSEGHHLQKLGGSHHGPDIRENILILCPTHHVEFDYGMIAIENEFVIHIDRTNSHHGKALAYNRDDLGYEYLIYHRNNIFNRFTPSAA